MEAVTIAGIAVVIFGGYYAAVDMLGDIGIRFNKIRSETTKPSFFHRCFLSS